MTLLVGDIGGTKTAFALIEEPSAQLTHVARYPSADFPGLEPIVQRFLSDCGVSVPERAVFAVAGPVDEGQARITNLPWFLSEAHLVSALGFEQVRLINDFEAVAYALPILQGPEQIVTLSAGAGAPKSPKNMAVLGAGTGLGEAFVVWTGTCYQPVATEGGHADFAPRDDLEGKLFCYLRERYGHVSWERIVSGMGLRDLYAFAKDTGLASETLRVQQLLESADDAGAVIGGQGLRREDPLSTIAVDLFVRSYGAEAGNLALKTMARGGVFLAGGIAPKLLPRLQDGAFLNAFLDKGRFRPLLETFPVHVIVEPSTALFGAIEAAKTMR